MHLFFGIALTLLSFAASANDSATPYIKVDSLTTKNGVTTIKGGDAYKLYNVLPGNYVYDVSRQLVIAGKKGSLSINCEQQDATNGADESKIKGDPTSTTCTIATSSRTYDPSKDEGDSFVWEGLKCESKRDPQSLPKFDFKKKTK